jgi:hypothetical protein
MTHFFGQTHPGHAGAPDNNRGRQKLSRVLPRAALRMTLFDVGAHAGLTTVELCNRPGPPAGYLPVNPTKTLPDSCG